MSQKHSARYEQGYYDGLIGSRIMRWRVVPRSMTLHHLELLQIFSEFCATSHFFGRRQRLNE